MDGVEPLIRSPRVQLADLALRVVTRTSGAALSDASRLWVTGDRDREIHGITVIAAPGGRFDVALHLVATWPPEPLYQLADELRGQILAAAEQGRLAGRLGEVDVHVEAIEDPDQRGLGGAA